MHKGRITDKGTLESKSEAMALGSACTSQAMVCIELQQPFNVSLAVNVLDYSSCQTGGTSSSQRSNCRFTDTMLALELSTQSAHPHIAPDIPGFSGQRSRHTTPALVTTTWRKQSHATQSMPASFPLTCQAAP
jgi:hypothetical protein